MDYSMLSRTKLFQGCSEEEIKQIGNCLFFRTESFFKGACLYHAGEIITSVGMVLSGTVQIENNDCFGNKNILDLVHIGEIFAESYACVPNTPLMIDVVAATDCTILFIDVPHLFETGERFCSHQSKLIRNLLSICSMKNVNLTQKIYYTSSKTIRGRLLSFLSNQAALQKTTMVTIPLNRQQLADYLCVERSALSKELGKMKRDGLLDYHKNQFQLYVF